MTNLQRYSMVDAEPTGFETLPCADGEWVKYEDVRHLLEATTPATRMRPVFMERGVQYYVCQHYAQDAQRRCPCDQGCK
jgi:hypothetical protein